MTMTNSPHPPVKWAGGKRQLLPVIRQNIPEKFNRYFEPFVGGGAVFFGVQPQDAYISDLNGDLIDMYTTIRDQPQQLLADLQKHHNTRQYFLSIRAADLDPAYQAWSPAQKASRLIYLNKTCYNGLYRVNSRGHFNVPFGDNPNARIVDIENILSCSAALQRTEIRCADFAEIGDLVGAGDFVYLDPPYVALTQTASFTAYTKDKFDLAKQQQLRALCERLDQIGAKFLQSNSDTPLIHDLYSAYTIQTVVASRAINANATKRGKITEVLIKNY